MDRIMAIGAVLLVLSAAGPAVASFGAADLCYIPVVAYSTGSTGSLWKTDVYITNVDDVDIDIAMVYLPSGTVDNSGAFISRDTWLGGREEDAFGLINEALASIPPNGSVVLRDIVGEYWAGQLGLNGQGALVVAAYEADTLEDDGSRVYKNALVNARIYNDTMIWEEDPDNPGEFDEVAAQYGQLMPGVPWYNLADGGAVGDTTDFSFEILNGGEESGRLRYNVGMVNASDPQTQLTMQIQPFQPTGEPYLDADDNEILSIVNLLPGMHVQLFRPFMTEWEIDDAEGATLRVSIVAWTSTSPNPVPLFTSYGSVVHNSTNDPTTVLPSFGYPYDVECMWGGDEGVKAGRPTHRPIAIPPR